MKEDPLIVIGKLEVRIETIERYENLDKKQVKENKLLFEGELKGLGSEFDNQKNKLTRELNLALEEAYKRHKEKIRKERNVLIYPIILILENITSIISKLIK